MADSPAPPGESTSTSLLQRVKARDRAAWERFVDLYGPLVYAWCRQAGLPEAEALDVGREVFRAVARDLDGFRHQRPGESFRGGLRTMAQRQIRAFTPDSATHRAAESTEPNATAPDGLSLADEIRILYRRAVELLREEFAAEPWQAFWQVIVEGRAATDVALDLDVTVEAVHLAKSRVLHRLREEFGALLDEDEPEEA